jgi:hypothetical protein
MSYSARLSLILVATLTVVLLAAVPAGARRTCDGKPATIQRGDGDNDLAGTPGADVIVAGGGDDSVEAGGGRDRVCGEGGNDALHGGVGGDPLVNGGRGRDQLIGADGADQVAGGKGDEVGTVPFRAGTLEATLIGGAGDDDLLGGLGGDFMDDSTGPRTGAAADVDRIFASGGSDSYDVFDGDTNDIIDCTSPCAGSADPGDDVGGLATASAAGG